MKLSKKQTSLLSGFKRFLTPAAKVKPSKRGLGRKKKENQRRKKEEDKGPDHLLRRKKEQEQGNLKKRKKEQSNLKRRKKEQGNLKRGKKKQEQGNLKRRKKEQDQGHLKKRKKEQDQGNLKRGKKEQEQAQGNLKKRKKEQDQDQDQDQDQGNLKRRKKDQGDLFVVISDITMSLLSYVKQNKEMLWTKLNESTVAPAPLLKNMMRIIFSQILKTSHGDVKFENVLVCNNNPQNIFLVNGSFLPHSKESVRKDFLGFRDMLQEIILITKPKSSALHAETGYFLQALSEKGRNLDYMRYHYWFHSTSSRIRFLKQNYEKHQKCWRQMRLTNDKPILEIPHGLQRFVEGSPNIENKNSILLKVIDGKQYQAWCKWPPKVYRGKRFITTFEFFRDYFSHAIEASQPAITKDAAVAEVLILYPDLMEQIYKKLDQWDMIIKFCKLDD